MVRMADWRWAPAVVLPALALLGLVATGCGTSSASSSSKPAVISSGQVPRSAVLVGGNGGAGSTGTTVPLAKQNPTTALFSAIGVFQSCLKGMGVTFAGVPGGGDPNSPTNNPNYIKSLTTCAAQSNIIQALKSEQTAQENLTPKQVAQENKGYLKWRKCMIGRGWTVPVPKPDAKGALFSFGSAGSSSGPQMTPPPGESLLSSPDLQECADAAQKAST